MRRRYDNTCDRCGCALDANEGRYCDECEEEIAEEAAYAKEHSLTMRQAKELRDDGILGK